MFFTVNPDVSVRLCGGKGALLYHPDSNQRKYINSSGLFVWLRLRGYLSVTEIAEQVKRHFRCPSGGEVAEDLSSFLEDLRISGYVGESSGRRPCGGEATYPHHGDGPQTIDISITGKCNLDCMHCFYSREMCHRHDLETGQWLSFFEEIGSLGVQDVTLTGGEVFLRDDLWDLLDGIISNRMRYSLLTNGTLLSDETLHLLGQGRRALRLNSIQVSIDGSCSEVHDRIRGKGAFDKAVRSLRLLKEAGFPVTSRVTISRYNADDLENLARFLLEEIGLAGFSTNEAMPMGAGCSHQNSLSLTPEQELNVMNRLAKLQREYNGRVTAMAGPLAKWKCFQAMVRAKSAGEEPRQAHMGRLSACGSAFTKLAVHHDGVISPCHLLPKVVLGRINSDSIMSIWRSHPALAALKARRLIPMIEVEGCSDCEWAPFCNGGCPGLAQEITGDLNRANPQDCYREFAARAGGLF